MKRVALLAMIACLCFAAGFVLHGHGGQLTDWTQMQVSDFLMVSASGPRLGGRSTTADISLVFFDRQTAAQLGYVRSFDEDVRVYKNLLAAGARVVLDTRGIAAATPEAFEELRPLLDQMLAIDDQGRLLRDVWLSPQLDYQQYDCLLTQNVISSHPHAMPQFSARLYPLSYFTAEGPRESAPVLVARKFWDLPRTSSEEIGAELLRCGVISEWHRRSPELVPASEVPSTPYQIGERRQLWYPFESTSDLVPPAAFWVDYAPPLGDFRRHSFANVMQAATPEDFRDQIVVIGFDAEIDPSSDSYAIPNYSGKASSAEVVACATATVLDGLPMQIPPAGISLISIAVLSFGMSLVAGFLKPLQATATAILILALYFSVAVFAYRSGWYADFVIAPVCGVAATIGGGLVNALHTLRSRQRVVDLFGRYVPRDVVNQLIQRSELDVLTVGGINREVTVLFADIRGFTSYSQDLPPEEVVKQLNSLLETLVACTFEHGGTLDKFIGDAILVLFNAPLDQPDHVERAARTALSMQSRLKGHASGLSVGIGVHRGEAIVGNIGTPQRLEYTAIGSTVNIASRLCDAAEPGEIMISKSVWEVLPDEFITESIGSIPLKGIKQPLEVARLMDMTPKEI